MIQGYIYRLTSPSKKCYIGQTIDINKRMSAYRTFHHCQNQKKLFNAIKKYGFENFKLDILQEVIAQTKEDLKQKLNILEIEYIYKHNSVEIGYNICNGGNQHRLGVKETEEQIQKKKERWTLERRIAQSERYKGNGNPRFGKKFGTSKLAKQINQFTLGGEFVQCFESIVEASKLVLSIDGKVIPFQNIAKVVNKQNKTAGGYIWRVKQETIIDLNDLTRKKRNDIDKTRGRKIYQFDLNNSFIKEFDNVSQASKELSIVRRNIVACYLGKRKTAGGFVWKLFKI